MTTDLERARAFYGPRIEAQLQKARRPEWRCPSCDGPMHEVAPGATTCRGESCCWELICGACFGMLRKNLVWLLVGRYARV